MTTNLSELYLTDETAWLDETASRIRSGRLGEIDYSNLAEFLESMAGRDRREVESRLISLIKHVLKWEYQPEIRGRSWQDTIRKQRRELDLLLENGTLLNHAETTMPKVYDKGRKEAAEDTRKPIGDFPAECPWTLNELLAFDPVSED